MKYPRFFIILLFLFLSLTGSATAIEELKQENILSFDLAAPDGLVLSGMTAEDIQPGTNTSIIMNAYGDEYTLHVNSTRALHANWKFDIKLISPNGSIETETLSTIQPFATNYDIHLQYYALEWDTAMDIDIYTGLLPLTASFDCQSPAGAAYADLLPDSMTYNTIAFSQISGTSTQPMTITIYASNEEEFNDQASGDLSTALNDAVNDVFAWTWDAVLSFVELIPGVGPYLATSLELAALTIDGVFFYFNLLFIEFAETTFISIEALIWTYGITGFKRGGLFGCLKKVCNTHMQIIETGFNLAQGSISILFRIFSGIASIVQALKP